MVDTSKMCFVFGSNEGGIHGAGAAKYAALCRGAKFGCGFGHTGAEDIKTAPGSFAIPTKSLLIEKRHTTVWKSVGPTLPLDVIQRYVNAFLTYAHARPDLQFQVTCIGCGLAGLKHEDIAPMFYGASDNCYFDNLWFPYLTVGAGDKPQHKFWGTF